MLADAILRVNVYMFFGFISVSMAWPTKLNILQCQSRCRKFGGCSHVRYSIRALRCELVFGDNDAGTEKEGTKILKIQHTNSSIDCPQKEVLIHRRPGSPKCVKVSRDNYQSTTNQKTECSDCEPTNNSCIRHRQINTTCRGDNTHVVLPFALMPQMKLTVYGAFLQGKKYSQFGFNTNTNKTHDPSAWMLFRQSWLEQLIIISHGGDFIAYNGKFPISDYLHFCLSMELTRESTRVHINKALVYSYKTITGLREFDLRYYSKIHMLVVQRMSDECANVDNGIPKDGYLATQIDI